VIETAVYQLPNPMKPDEIRDGNLQYVGLTRAIDHLAVTWVGRSTFTDRVVCQDELAGLDSAAIAR
jgi:hypothetical protein